MGLSCPNNQRYHSDDFKKQSETQEILSAIGCVILKFVGTSCGLGLMWWAQSAPMVVIGLTELPNSEWAKAHPPHPLAAELNLVG